MRKVLFLLGHLSDNDVEWLIDNGLRTEVPGGTVLITTDLPLDTLYLLLSGTLEVHLPGGDGKKSVALGAGEIIGEISLLDSRRPTASVAAANDCIVLSLPHEILQEKLREDSDFAARFYHALAVFLAHRIRNTYARLGFDDGREMDEDEDYEDELSPEVLDNLHLAGSRFDHVLRKLLTS
ncbi:cyclic nucleotide-binding domain-containing protein [Lignipirellula cremea]|uniref:DNA-binding transcriptional dual regulator Crp n=1 Tax=Lignipirellula cremea TaxID=2528010 RepID=A0A518DQM9_9BACT|nr:cyclic nucleotide-binding domain-containing protein [Lignipirellula cremea]QDU94143.1 DNA-binding transcriptional dual regulator Crp [Lignipirellula cremea]